MSIIETIRKRAGIMVIAIAVSLIGFLVQDAFFGRGHGGFKEPSKEIGEVNGTGIGRVEFDNRVKMMESQYQSQGYRIEEGMRQEIQSQVWNGLVSRELILAEARKLGIEFTPKEFSELLFSDNAPQEFKQQFTDPKTGIYNIEAARTAFINLKKSKDPNQIAQVNEQLIDPIVLNQLQQKFMTIFTNGLYIPKWLIEKQNAVNGQVSGINYTGLAYSTIADSTVKVSDSDITEYIQKNKDQFKQERSRSIAFVTFNAGANQEDSTNLWNRMEQLKKGLAEAPDAGVFVTRNGSKNPFFDGYINKSRIQVPSKDSLLALQPGQVYGPYFDASNVTIARMIGSKILPDSVKARHILISLMDLQTQQPIRTDSVAKALADSIKNAIAAGASFVELTQKYSDDLGSKENGGEYNYFPNGQMVKEFNDFCFEGKVGDKGVVKTQFGYHYIEVQDQKNFETAYKIAYLAKPIEPSKETDDAASAAATKFASESRTEKAFNDAVIKNKENKRIADNIKEMDYQVAGLPASRSFVKWVYENKTGTVSDPISVGDQYVVAAITGEKPAGLQSAATAKLVVEPVLRNKKKAVLLTQKFGKYTTIEEAAKNTDQQVQAVDSIRFSDNFKPGLGNEPIIIGAAFNKAYEGKASQPITGTTGVFVVNVKNIGALPNDAANVEEQRKATLMQMKQMIGYGLMEALKEAANIKDTRLKGGF